MMRNGDRCSEMLGNGEEDGHDEGHADKTCEMRRKNIGKHGVIHGDDYGSRFRYDMI